jgi:aminomethyltransferase
MKRTPLYDTHVALGARMVDFAGWSMPVHYPTGIQQEHIAVRSDAGLFDVSHMGEIRVLGDDATAFLQFATLNDPGRLKAGRGQYTMLPNDQGGLIDDLYVYREKEQEYLIVANAANVEAVLEHVRALAEDYDCHVVDESATWALLALQGPGSALRLGHVVDADLTELRKNATLLTTVSGCPVRLSRTGYTGEDGFELFCHPTDAPIVWDVLTDAGAVPCGLGARDTLRLEAGFPLYGHEFDETTNPLCSPFAWVVKDKPFHGREAIWDRSCPRRLIGFRLLERGIPRQGYRIFRGDAAVGQVTSGTLSPLTRESIGFAWVDADAAEEGTELHVEIRGQKVPATVVKPPFFGQ